jgi:NAD(P)-dependent dehydrogenase (short-subunit alcohol dehydrogenase family)
MTRQFLPLMREARRGRIINFSSVVANIGAPGASHYAAAKAAIQGFTKSVALEVASRGITVNSIALGYFGYGLIDSVSPEMQRDLKQKIPLGRFGAAPELAGVIEYLLGDAGAYVTGQAFHINGGQFLV